MARTRAEAQITTRNARRQLKPRKKAYWRSLGPNAAIGYRRRPRGGFWMAGEYLGKGRYREEQIGVADDHLDADGIDVLDFEQAKAKAAVKIASWRAHDRASVHGPVPTVRSAVEVYLTAAERRRTAQGIIRADTGSRMRKHVLNDAIADVPLHELNEHHLVQWRQRRPSSLASGSVKRIVIELKAALNATAKTHRSKLPADIAVTIRHGLSYSVASTPIARDGAALPDPDVRRVLDATEQIDAEGGWDGDLLRLIAVLAATGARFSQIVRMHVADFQIAQSRLMVPTSRKGRSNGGKSAHIAVRIGADVVELLRPAAGGRKPGEPLLERWWHRQQVGREWARDRRGSWADPSELHHPWSKIIARAGLPEGTIPYALRHSSIVRMLKAGLPVRVVAQIHDTSTVMLEKHYSGAISDMMEDVIAAAIVPLLPPQGREKVAATVKAVTAIDDDREDAPRNPALRAAALKAAADLGDGEGVREQIVNLLRGVEDDEFRVAAAILSGEYPGRITIAFGEARGRKPEAPRPVSTSQGLVSRFDIAQHVFEALGAPSIGDDIPRSKMKQAIIDTAIHFATSDKVARDCYTRYGRDLAYLKDYPLPQT